MKSSAPSQSPFTIALSPDGEGYVVSYQEAGFATPCVQLCVPRELIEAVVIRAASVSLEIAADGLVTAYADRGDGRTLAQVSIERLISEALDVADRDSDLAELEVLETNLDRSLDAVRRVRNGLARAQE